jgi:hypothetical protein
MRASTLEKDLARASFLGSDKSLKSGFRFDVSAGACAFTWVFGYRIVIQPRTLLASLWRGHYGTMIRGGRQSVGLYISRFTFAPVASRSLIRDTAVTGQARAREAYIYISWPRSRLTPRSPQLASGNRIPEEAVEMAPLILFVPESEI